MFNKSKAIDIYYKISYILEFILSVPLAIFVLSLRYNKICTGVLFLSDVIPVAILGLAVFAIIVTHVLKYRDKVEKMFLSFAIPIGMMYMIYILPTYVPDENYHLTRAYQISIGNFIEQRVDGSEEVYMPKNIVGCTVGYIHNYGEMFENLIGNNNYDDTMLRTNTAQSYFPVLYMFSSIGLFIGKLLLLNPFITIYLARVFNFIAYLVLGYFTIKKLPFGKLVALTYLMLPMVLQQAVSISADSLTNSVSIFFIAYTLSLVKRDKVMTKKEEILYYILVTFVAIAKIAYMPLVVLSWLFIGNKNYSKKQKARIILISTLLGIVASFGWYVYSAANYPDTREYITENGVSSSEQIKFILAHPTWYVRIILDTLQKQGADYIYTFIGQRLGWLNISIDMLTVIAFIILGVLSPFLSKNKKSLNKIERLWLCVIFVGVMLLVLTGLYLAWTPVGHFEILGIQGRYFIPVGILLLLCLCVKDRFIDFKYTNVVYPAILGLLNYTVLKAIILFFIG